MIRIGFALVPPALGLWRVVPARQGGELPAECERACAVGRFGGGNGEACEAWTEAGPVLLVGIGQGSEEEIVRAGGEAAGALATRATQLVLDARGLSPDQAAALAFGAAARMLRQDLRRTRPVADEAPPILSSIDVLTRDPPASRTAWAERNAVLEGVAFAREVVALPPNELTPASYAKRLEAFAQDGIDVEIWGPRELAKRGFGGLLAVGQGSEQTPRLVVLRWRGSGSRAPVALVGKGITFDTGGISIKPASKMEEMKADMAGSAACAGAILALARRRSPCPVVAVLALAENAIGGSAMRPSDVLTMLDGSRVEVVDTDAEGRLVLADALAHAAAAFSPRAMIDLATLTGSIVVALGRHRAGMFASDPALASHLAAAGEAVGELVWPMPLDEAYAEDLRSDIADIRHCVPARMQPDACHAAMFLRRFVPESIPWAHLDIAGVELRDEPDALGPAGATGFGVRLLDRLIALRFEGDEV